MMTIEQYREAETVEIPVFGGKELPQLVDLLADAYGHLNCFANPDSKTRFAKRYLRDALNLLGIDIKDYKV